MTVRTPYDGVPFYCDHCGVGYNEYMACEGRSCVLETAEAAKLRHFVVAEPITQESACGDMVKAFARFQESEAIARNQASAEAEAERLNAEFPPKTKEESQAEEWLQEWEQQNARKILERHHGLLALEELNQTAAKLASLLQRDTFDLGDPRFASLYATADKAMARIARLGTDRPFDLDGKNPIEEASRMATFYRDAWLSGDALKNDHGKRAAEFLERYGCSFHDLKTEQKK